MENMSAEKFGADDDCQSDQNNGTGSKYATTNNNACVRLWRSLQYCKYPLKLITGMKAGIDWLQSTSLARGIGFNKQRRIFLQL